MPLRIGVVSQAYHPAVGGVTEHVDATVRVLIESGDASGEWGTVGVSSNVIDASWQALVDSFEYKLYKDEKEQQKSAAPDARARTTTVN